MVWATPDGVSGKARSAGAYPRFVNLAADAATTAAPFWVRLLLLIVLALAGLAIGTVGFLGWRGALRRNPFAGVRTRATMRDDETFRLANQVGGLPMLVAGLVGVVGGVVAFGMPSGTGTVIAVLIGVAGMIGMSLAGGLLGHRAAAAMPEPAAPKGCGGCACGGAGGCSALAALSGGN